MPDTIVALSSPPGPAPRGVLRLSGPRAQELAASLLSSVERLRPWRLVPAQLSLPAWPPIPAQLLSCPAPRSYTGEDVVELWVPGAPPLVRRLLVTLQERGARLADRGEFTRRAFLAGRLELLQVEAVLALTSAADAESSRAALRVLEGGVGLELEALKQALLDLRAHLEAAIDFSEEELDLADNELLAARLDELAGTLGHWRARSRDASSEPLVVLRGPTNAGKSTLFNRLCGADALVSDQAGTTRDVLEGTWELGDGLEVRVLDTAGLGADGLEGEAAALDAQALEHARERAASADLVLWLSPVGAELGELPPRALLVRTKRDLSAAPPPAGELWISTTTGTGLDELDALIRERLAQAAPSAGLFGSARQDGWLARATGALRRASLQLRGADPARAELAAVDVAEALDALGQLTGEVRTEDMLGRIFSSFCIGK